MRAKKANKIKSRTKPKIRAKSKANTRARTRTAHPHSIEVPTPPPTPANAFVKTCQEVEVGDIGGFGSPEELEEHEKRCSEPATEFCNNCGKNICRNHYELIHRDHNATGRTPSQAPA